MWSSPRCETVDILKGTEVALLKSTTASNTRAAHRAGCRRTERQIHQRPPPARQGHRRDRRGRCCATHPGAQAQEDHRQGRIEEIVAKIARIPPANVSTTTATSCRRWSATSRAWCLARTRRWRCWPPACQNGALRPGQKADKPIGSFLFPAPPASARPKRPNQLAYIMGIELIRFDMSGVHGAPCREPPDLRAPATWLRPGRSADRSHHEEAARRAAARRDREGAPGHLQRAAAGHGPRHADGQQRPQGRLPQRASSS